MATLPAIREAVRVDTGRVTGRVRCVARGRVCGVARRRTHKEVHVAVVVHIAPNGDASVTPLCADRPAARFRTPHKEYAMMYALTTVDPQLILFVIARVAVACE